MRVTGSGRGLRWGKRIAGRRVIAVGFVGAVGVSLLAVAFIEVPGMVVDHDLGNPRKAEAPNATFRDADLRGADLRGADLSSADLDGAQLEAAVASDQIRWPAAFDPDAAGVTTAADPGPEAPPLLQPPAFL